MEKYIKLYLVLLFLQILSYQRVVFSSAAGAPVASWAVPSLPVVSDIDDTSSVVNDVSQNIGAPLADAIALLANGAVSPQPYLNYSWLTSFATALSSGVMPYSGMNSLVLADLFQGGKSSVEYSYIMNHLVPALQEIGTNLKSSDSSLIGTLDNVVITTINNNTQMNFDIYQGSNAANVGASNVNLQQSGFSGGANSFYPGFKIGSLKPGVNNVALYGAAQGQGDILFIPNDGSGTVPTSGISKGSFRVSFIPSSQSSTSAYVCVQILSVDFPSGENQETIKMFQRNQCIDVSQVKNAVNLTLKIEDHMVVWAPATPATATTPKIKEISMSTIDQSIVSMYYPSIRSMVSNRGNVLFLSLPENIMSYPVIVSWVNFINIIIGALQVNRPPYLMTPNNLANALAQQPVMFLLKQKGTEFGSVSKLYRPKDFITGKNNQTASYTLPIKSLSQPSAVSEEQLGLFGYGFAGLVETQYLFTGDIPSLDDFQLFLQMNSSLNNQQQAATLSFAKSITEYNIWQDLQKKGTSLFADFIKQVNVQVKLVSTSGEKAFYTFNTSNNSLQNLSSFVPSDGLLMYFLSKSKDVFSFPQNRGASVLFSMSDIVTHLQALINNAKNKLYMPAANGLWGYLQAEYAFGLQLQQGAQGGYIITNLGSLPQDLKKNQKLLKALLIQKEASLFENINQNLYDTNQKALTFKSFDVLQSVVINGLSGSMVLFPSGKLVPLSSFNNQYNSSDNTPSLISLSSGELKQLKFEPIFTDGSYANLSLQEASPSSLNKLSDILKIYQCAKISFEIKPHAQKGYDAIIKVDTLSENGSINAFQFSYVFKDLINAKDNKTPIVNSVELSGLKVTYQSNQMLKPSVVSMPKEGFGIWNKGGMGLLFPITQASAKAKSVPALKKHAKIKKRK